MDTQQESTSDQDISTIVSQLPLPVQKFFASGKIEIVAKNIMQKYQLHIDQGTIVEREIILLLLGLKNPDEFTQALAEEAKLDQKTIDSIVQDVNDQIFIPLREEERKSGTTVAPPAAPASGLPRGSNLPKGNLQSYAPRPFEARQSAGVTGPPPQSPTYFHLENKITPPLRPIRPAQPPVMTTPVKQSVPQQSQPVVSITPKPIAGEKLLEDREEPSLSFKAMNGAAKPIPGEKLLEDREEPHIEFKPTAPRIVPPPPPANLPGAMPDRPVVSDKVQGASLPAIQPPVPSSHKPSTLPLTPVPAKPYSSDPYREPIDEITT